MTDIAIRVENLSKLYPELSARACHLGAVHQRPDTLREALVGMFRRADQSTNPQSTHSDDLWALKGVSFEVKRGKVVGTLVRATGNAAFHGHWLGAVSCWQHRVEQGSW